MDRYICIHGHFYQPPRENPWLEAIEIQDEAYPYHDWNQRITAECYAANAASRILDDQDRIVRIVNNYVKMSFNFGPTLLSWLETHSPFVYRAVLEADQESRDHFSGHGSAMAQAYNHLIMPLANRRDKETQVVWGIRDFERRFGRRPEGMWLPETAVDLDTLEILANHGIAFTLLAPRQAWRVRSKGEEPWTDVSGEQVNPRVPYDIRLPSGRNLALFFYDGVLSKAVAFERLLSSGETFAKRLAGGFAEEEEPAQLVHIATDGESYGHHHRFGDMALAYALHYIETHDLARITNYGEFLEKHPPEHEVEIFEDTSWSCAHGVARWKADCGCSTGAHPGWSQAWRAPLREALDGLRKDAARVFEAEGARVFRDPWAARNAYIDVVLDRSEAARTAFFKAHAAAPPAKGTEQTGWRLMELQRQTLLMYTSCGWFFDDLSGIETVQVLQYAARAVELIRSIGAEDPEPSFRENLARAQSNRPDRGNGWDVYTRYAKRGAADFQRIAAHYAMSSLFREAADEGRFYCYRAEEEERIVREAGKATLLLGRARFVSEITQEARCLCYGALHLGDHNLSGGAGEDRSPKAFGTLASDLSEVFDGADFHETLRRFDRHFEHGVYGLKALYRDEQRRILDRILDATLKSVEGVYRRLYDDQVPLMRFLLDADAPVPRALRMAAELVMQNELKRRLEEDDLDPERIQALLQEARGVGIALDPTPLEFSYRRSLERTAARLREHPEDVDILDRVTDVLGLLDDLPFTVNLRTVQNIGFDLRESLLAPMRERAEHGDVPAQAWIDAFVRMSIRLGVRVE